MTSLPLGKCAYIISLFPDLLTGYALSILAWDSVIFTGTQAVYALFEDKHVINTFLCNCSCWVVLRFSVHLTVFLSNSYEFLEGIPSNVVKHCSHKSQLHMLILTKLPHKNVFMFCATSTSVHKKEHTSAESPDMQLCLIQLHYILLLQYNTSFYPLYSPILTTFPVSVSIISLLKIQWRISCFPNRSFTVKVLQECVVKIH